MAGIHAVPTGLHRYFKDQCYQGYNLFPLYFSKETLLLNMEGEIVHSWQSDYMPGLFAHLLPDGTLLRGIRVQAVVTELQGEKIDIIPYSEDRAQYIVSALAPAEVTPLSEDKRTVRVVLHQGVYHQIKLMFGVYGAGVDALHREAIGGVALDEALAPGQWRELSAAEVAAIAGG